MTYSNLNDPRKDILYTAYQGNKVKWIALGQLKLSHEISAQESRDPRKFFLEQYEVPQRPSISYYSLHYNRQEDYLLS